MISPDENIEYISIVKQDETSSYEVDNWQGDDIIIHSEVSASDKDGLDRILKEKNPYRVEHLKKEKTLILILKKNDPDIIIGGGAVDFDVTYKISIPERLKIIDSID